MQWVQVLYLALGAVFGAIAAEGTRSLVERRRERRRDEQQRREQTKSSALELRQRSRRALDDIENAYELVRTNRDGWQALVQSARDNAFLIEYGTPEFYTGPAHDEVMRLASDLFHRVAALANQLTRYRGGEHDSEIEQALAEAWERREALRKLLLSAAPPRSLVEGPSHKITKVELDKLRHL